MIALTHMRLPNDLELAEEVPEIDVILGGHDHNYVCESVNLKRIISMLFLNIKFKGKWTMGCEKWY